MLKEMRKTISLAQLAKHAERIADDIEASGTIYCVKRRGKSGLMLLDAEAYEGCLVAIELMKQPNWREEWATARGAAARGEGRNLEAVAKELDLDRPARLDRRKAASGATTTRRAKGARSPSRARKRTA
jgi:hypothetical protein